MCLTALPMTLKDILGEGGELSSWMKNTLNLTTDLVDLVAEGEIDLALVNIISYSWICFA